MQALGLGLLTVASPLALSWVASGAYGVYRFAYLHGPGVMGAWEGQPVEEVCARLTQTPLRMWLGTAASGECAALIDRKVTSHLVGSLAVIAAVTLYHAFQCLSYLLFWSACSRLRGRDAALPPP